MPNPLLLESLSHHYERSEIYSNLSLEVMPGELLAVLGHSGCGKSTLLRTVAGLATPSAGRILINGEVVADKGQILVPIEQRRIGLVFQDYALFPFMSVRENIAFGLDSAKDPRVDDLMDLTGISELSQRRPQTLSGGQQQRVALARALAPKPHLLLLDEAFANVDATRRQKLGEILVETLKQEKRAGLFVTHDQTDAMAYASRIAVFTTEDGRSSIRQCDSPEVVFRNPTTRAVAECMGPVNFVSAEAKGDRAESAFGTHELINKLFGEVDLVFRSDDLEFSPDASGAVVVRSVSYMGTQSRVNCDSPGGPMCFDVRTHPPQPGTRGCIVMARPAWAISSS